MAESKSDPHQAPIEWDYAKHPDRANLLPPRIATVLEEIAMKTLDGVAFVLDSRSVHERLFAGLVLAGQPDYFAGHYRGEDYPHLKGYTVGIQGNPSVGAPPNLVAQEMKRFQVGVRHYLRQFDTAAARVQDRSKKLLTVVPFAAHVFSEFLRIHPYANGNGHIGRIMLVALMMRYGFTTRTFPIEPGPSQHSQAEAHNYNLSIYLAQHGHPPHVPPDPSALHQYILDHFKTV